MTELDNLHIVVTVLRDCLQRAEKDAARYRWLRDHSGLDIRSLLDVGDFTELSFYIDCAIRDRESKAAPQSPETPRNC